MTQDGGDRTSRLLPRLVTSAILFYAAGLYALGWMYPDRYQLTFEASYYGAKAFDVTGNPYDAETVRALAGKAHVYPFVKLPLTAFAYKPFTYFDIVTAKRIFLSLKAATLLLLVWLWCAKFLRQPLDPLFLGVCFFGFNFAFFWDFWSGNVNLFGYTLLWFGFYAYTKKRYGFFTIATVLASFWKLTPVFFLSLLFFVPGRAKWRWIIAGAVLFAAIHGASPLLYPDLMDDFYESASKMRGLRIAGEDAEYENGSESTLIVYSTLATVASRESGIAVPRAVPYALYLATAALVAGITCWVVRRNPTALHEDERMNLVFFACLVYLLVLPRALLYSYVIAILPAYFVARRFTGLNGAHVLLALMFIAPVIGRPTGINFLYDHFIDFYPLFLVYALWAAAIWLSVTGAPGTGAAAVLPSDAAPPDPMRP